MHTSVTRTHAGFVTSEKNQSLSFERKYEISVRNMCLGFASYLNSLFRISGFVAAVLMCMNKLGIEKKENKVCLVFEKYVFVI